MECKAVKDNISTSEILTESKTEQLIESEILLPEYCNEIMQILKCIPTIRIMSKQVTSNKMLLDGYVNFRVIYLSPDSDFINCFEQNIPFNKNIEFQSDYKDHMVDVNCEVDYLNCRAVNERRIDLRSSMSILTKVYVMKCVDVLENIDEATIQQYNKCNRHISTISLKEKNFTMNEMIMIDCENLNDMVVLKTNEYITITDYKCIANKCIIKGDIIIETYYMESRYDKDIKNHRQVIQLNQIVDITGVDEACNCIISPKILSCVFDKTNGDDDVKYMVNIYGSMLIKVYREDDVRYIKDVYSTKHNVEYTKKKIELDDLLTKRDIKVSKDIVLESFLNNCNEILDLTLNVKKPKNTMNNDCIDFNFDIDISCIYKTSNESIIHSMSDSEMCYSEYAIMNIDCSNCSILLNEVNYRYSMEGDDLHIHIDLLCNINLVSKNSVDVIDTVTMDKESQKEYEKNSALTIYYADKDESLWDIAKNYNTCIDEILKQNNIEAETLKERTMILIPIVR